MRTEQTPTQFLERDALTSRIDGLEALLLSVMSNADQQHCHIPPTEFLQLPDISVSRDHEINPRSYMIPTEQQIKREDPDVEQLGKEFGVLHVEPTQTLYYGGQHWVSTILQVRFS